MKIRGIIFDLGQTLMHLHGSWAEVFAQGAVDLAAFVSGGGLGLDGQAFAQALLARRREGFARALRTLREVTAEESMRATFAQFGLAQPVPELVEGAIDAFFAYEERCWLADPEAVPILQDLAGGGLRLGLYSNATHDPFIQRQVERLGFRPWLHPVLSSAGTGLRKPDPACLAPFLAAWGLPPGALAMVGDTPEADVLVAQRAGMRSVWLRTREAARQEGTYSGVAQATGPIVPDAEIERLSQLPACLERL